MNLAIFLSDIFATVLSASLSPGELYAFEFRLNAEVHVHPLTGQLASDASAAVAQAASRAANEDGKEKISAQPVFIAECYRHAGSAALMGQQMENMAYGQVPAGDLLSLHEQRLNEAASNPTVFSSLAIIITGS